MRPTFVILNVIEFLLSESLVVVCVIIVVEVSSFPYTGLWEGIDRRFRVLIAFYEASIGGELVICRPKGLRGGSMDLWMACCNGGWNWFLRNLEAGQMPK
jgi:hypothetical protein